MDSTADSLPDGHLSMNSPTPESTFEGRKKKKTLSDRFSKHRNAPNSERLGATAPVESVTQQPRDNDSDQTVSQARKPHEQTLPVLTRPFRPESSTNSNDSPTTLSSPEKELPRAERFTSKSKALDMSEPEANGSSNKIRPPIGSRPLLLDEEEEEAELPDEPAPKPPIDSRPPERAIEKPPLPENAVSSLNAGSQPSSATSPEVPARANRPRDLAVRSSSPDPNQSPAQSTPASTQPQPPPQPPQPESTIQSTPMPPQRSQTVSSALPPLPARAQLTASKQPAATEAAGVPTGDTVSRFDGDHSQGALVPLSRRARSSSSAGLAPDSAPSSARVGSVPDGRPRHTNLFRPASALSLASDGAASNISTGSTLRQLTTREAKAKCVVVFLCVCVRFRCVNLNENDLLANSQVDRRPEYALALFFSKENLFELL